MHSPGRAKSQILEHGGARGKIWSVVNLVVLRFKVVRIKNKNVTIFDHFISFTLTVKQSAALAACVLRATTKKVNFF